MEGNPVTLRMKELETLVRVPGSVDSAWVQLEPEFAELCLDYPRPAQTNSQSHLGTLGGGNHFIEVCLDEERARYFGDRIRAVGWAQTFAPLNREVMMRRVVKAVMTVIY